MRENPYPGRGQGYVVAVLLGTLSALGSPARAATELPAEQTRAIADLARYCSACWRNARVHPQSWADCTQEVFSRLLERVPAESWPRSLRQEGDERREFFRAIDAVKKRTQRARATAHLPEQAAVDRRDAVERSRADEREAIRVAAGTLLSARQRQILDLSFDGCSVQEISARLELPEARVSDEKYKAIRKLRRHFTS